MKHRYTGHPSQSFITCIPDMSFYHQETELFSFFPRLFGIDKISKLLLRYFTCRGTLKKLVLPVTYSETNSLVFFFLDRLASLRYPTIFFLIFTSRATMAKLEMPVIYSETRKFFSFHPDF